MITKRSPPVPIQNRLLAALPKSDRDRILPSFEVVPLKLKDFLIKPGQQSDYVHFPGGGFCSMVTVLEDGRMVEVATIGREGFVGVSATGNGIASSGAVLVQGETDTCYRTAAASFQSEMDRRGPFHALITRFTQALMATMMQSTACNAVHSVEQRLARWLLLAQDRMDSTEFPLTQEFVAMMLGATRPTVTVVAGTLQKAGLITYHRGRVKVLDRKKLEAASCECYRVATNILNSVTDTR